MVWLTTSLRSILEGNDVFGFHGFMQCLTLGRKERNVPKSCRGYICSRSQQHIQLIYPLWVTDKVTNASKIWLLHCWEFTVMLLTKTSNYYQPAPDYLCNKSKKTGNPYLELPLWLQTLDTILKWFVIFCSQTTDRPSPGT